METTEKKEEKSPILSDVERKRETISFQVTPKEKTQITYMAIKDCGISVSEFIRTKIFVEPKTLEPQDEVLPNPMDDEERAIYEEKLKEITAENVRLKDELIKVKVLKTELHQDEENTEIEKTVTNDINDLVIHLEPEFKQLFDRAKEYRDEQSKTFTPKRLQKEYYDFNKFLKVLILRGVKRSYSNNELKADTGLLLSDFTAMEAIAKIDSFSI